MPRVKNCAIVVRVSDPKAAEHEKNTIVLQIAEIRKYIEAKNFDQSVVYKEYKVYKLIGVSGSKSFVSKQFDELDMDIAVGKVDVVICTALDRLGRDVPGFISFWEDLKENNVELIITRMSLDTSTPLGSMLLVVLMALSKLELDIKTERNRSSTRARGKDGLYNGHRPILGYDMNPDPTIAGRLVVNDKEVPIVKMAFEQYLVLGSDKKVAELLTSHGFRNKRWKKRATGKWKGGGPITPAVVRTMLTNITYIALRNYTDIDPDTGEEIKKQAQGVWPAIIDVDLFNAVQEARARAMATKGNPVNRTAGQHFNLLTRIVKCKFCDGNMSHRSGTSRTKGRRYHYYTCMNNECPYFLEGSNKPKRNRVNADELDGVAYDMLTRIMASPEKVTEFTHMLNQRITEEAPELIGQMKRLTNLKRAFEGERRALMKSLGKLDKDSSAFRVTQEEIDKHTETLSGIEKNRKIYSDRLVQINKRKLSEEDVKIHLLNMSQLIQKGTEEQRRSVAHMLFSSVILDPKEARFNFHSDSYFLHQIVNRKRGVRPDRELAPRGGLEPST